MQFDKASVEDKEAVFFSSIAELGDKVSYQREKTTQADCEHCSRSRWAKQLWSRTHGIDAHSGGEEGTSGEVMIQSRKGSPLMQQRIAIVVPGIQSGGGVQMVASFLYSVLQQSGRYQPEFISLATSSRDKASVRLLSPVTWGRSPQVLTGSWQGITYRHVGALLPEFEFQRYRPRRALTPLLSDYDLIQVVAGGPATALAVMPANKPTCVFVATTARQERVSKLARMRGLAKMWLRAMTYIDTRIESHVLPRMSHVFAGSDYTRRLLSTMVPEHRLSLGVPGVDINLFHPADEYNYDGHILTVGRLADPRKNVRMLLRAYRELWSAFPKAPRLVLAGRSRPLGEDWALAMEWGIADYIDVYQNVTAQGLANLYRQASLFVLPSDEEGLGIVILEAMASGIPVVSTRCGGSQTAVVEGETGYLTPLGDATALVGKMQFLLENPSLRYQMGQTARQVVETRFSLAAAGNVYLRKYDEILNKGVRKAT